MGTFKRVTRKAFAFVCFASIPLSTYFIVMAEPAILLSKEQFLPSVFPMQLVMPTIVLIGLSNLLGIPDSPTAKRQGASGLVLSLVGCGLEPLTWS